MYNSTLVAKEHMSLNHTSSRLRLATTSRVKQLAGGRTRLILGLVDTTFYVAGVARGLYALAVTRVFREYRQTRNFWRALD